MLQTAVKAVMDQAAVLVLAAIALCCLYVSKDQNLVHDVILAVVSGLLGYMQRASRTSVSTPDGQAVAKDGAS